MVNKLDIEIIDQDNIDDKDLTNDDEISDEDELEKEKQFNLIQKEKGGPDRYDFKNHKVEKKDKEIKQFESKVGNILDNILKMSSQRNKTMGGKGDENTASFKR